MSLVDVPKLNYFVPQSLMMQRNLFRWNLKPNQTTTNNNQKKRRRQGRDFQTTNSEHQLLDALPKMLENNSQSWHLPHDSHSSSTKSALSLRCSKYPARKQTAEEIAWFSDSPLVCSPQVRVTEIGTLSITLWIWIWKPKCIWKCLVSTVSVDLSFTGEKYLFIQKNNW